MSRLPDIQEAFQSFLLAGDPVVNTHVVGTARVPVETRLGIYGNGYRTRLIEALEASFPVLRTVLEEADFHTLASRYIHSHPSTFFSIRYYGDQLAQFLAADEEYSKAPLLAQLAQWEWAMAAAFDAPDAQALGLDFFAQVAPEDWSELRFTWSPSVQLLALEWNVPQLWKAVTEESERPDPAVSEQPVPYLIWRRELQIYFRALAPAEATALAASRSGQSFGELCVLLCEHLADESEASLQAAGFLRGWVQSGLIVTQEPV